MADWEYGMMKMRGDGHEFDEEEIWSLAMDREAADCSTQKIKVKVKVKAKAKDGSWHHQSAAKMIPRASAMTPATRLQQSSAPVSIPDWSKIYGGNGSNWVDHDGYGCVGDDQECGDGDDMVPPHEWVARRLAGTQISSFSMCEGIGRTLKGRDLSKVRNAILTKTGFLE